MKKSVKWLLISAVTVLVLVVGVLIAGTVIRKKIEKELLETKLGDIRFTSQSVRVNLFQKSLTLKGVHLQTEERKIPPDSLLNIPIQYVDATFESITLRGIGIRALRNRQIDFSTLLIDSPKATLVTRQIPKDTLPMHSDQKTALEALESIGIDDIRVSNGFFFWQQITETDTLEYRINGLNARVNGLQVDSTRSSRENFLYSKNIEGSAETFRYTFGNRAYILALDSLDWNYAAQSLSAANAELMPQYSKQDFPRLSVRKSDYMQLDLKRLALAGIDFDHFWNEKQLKVDSIYATKGNFTSYKDRNAVVPVRVKPMIHTTIQNIPIPIQIRKIRLEDMNATYEELAKHGNYAGAVTFNNIDATLFGFTNIVTRADQYVELYATSKVNGAGELTAVVSMPVDPENDHFEAKATLVNIPMSALNRMVTPLARMEIKSGYIDRMDFTMAGGDATAQADMVLRYRDLEVSVLRVRDRQWQERSGISNLVNWAIIRQSNPDKNGLRTASNTIRRDYHRSVFNYLWKGISAGAMETAETGTAKRLLSKR